MPELPEVETIRQDLRRLIVGKSIHSTIIIRDKTVRGDREAFVAILKNNAFREIERIGKLLLLPLADGVHTLLVHLKMTGQLIYERNHQVVAGGHSDSPLKLDVPNAYTRVTVSFVDGSRLHFNDMRVFGYMQLVDAKQKEATSKLFGIEPLTIGFTFDEFTKRLGRRNTTIKAALLNQAIFAGIGNIYADEACFAAGIRPGRRVCTLTTDKRWRLHRAIEMVMRMAIRERGTTFNDYIDPFGHKGNYLSFLEVYGRGGQPCRRCESMLKRTIVAGRGTVYCPKCQV